MSFLITSPLINEIAVVLLWGLLGWKFTIIYVVVGMVAGIIAGCSWTQSVRNAGCNLSFWSYEECSSGYGHTTGASTK